MVEKDTLPPPVTAPVSAPSSRSTRFAPPPTPTPTSQAAKIRVHWAKLRKRIGSGSVEAISDSVLEDNTQEGSLGAWRRASDHNHLTNAATYAGSHQHTWNAVVGGGQEPVEPDEVDEVVVDNEFEGYTCPYNDDEKSGYGRTSADNLAHSHHPETASHNFHTTDKDSNNTVSVWDSSFVLSALRYRVLPVLARFNSLAFNDPVAESQYMRESW